MCPALSRSFDGSFVQSLARNGSGSRSKQYCGRPIATRVYRTATNNKATSFVLRTRLLLEQINSVVDGSNVFLCVVPHNEWATKEEPKTKNVNIHFQMAK